MSGISEPIQVDENKLVRNALAKSSVAPNTAIKNMFVHFPIRTVKKPA